MDAHRRPPAIRRERLLVVRSGGKGKQTKRHAQAKQTFVGVKARAILPQAKNIRAKLSFLNNWLIFAAHKLHFSIRKERLWFSAFRVIL